MFFFLRFAAQFKYLLLKKITITNEVIPSKLMIKSLKILEMLTTFKNINIISN